MGLTLVAILTAALLLPGLIAARAFYYAGQTPEVEVPLPSLSTAEGLSLVGVFSVWVHAAYVVVLKIVSIFPPVTGLPLANPYLLFADANSLRPLDAAWVLFSGLCALSLMALLSGLAAGKVAMRFFDPSFFYGPLTEVIRNAKGADKFITAYVVSKIEKDGSLVGYQGTVDSLFRDADRFPTKVVLKDVVPFYLTLGDEGPKRIETTQVIDWIVLSSADWHNIAFRVTQVIDDATRRAANA